VPANPGGQTEPAVTEPVAVAGSGLLDLVDPLQSPSNWKSRFGLCKITWPAFTANSVAATAATCPTVSPAAPVVSRPFLGPATTRIKMLSARWLVFFTKPPLGNLSEMRPFESSEVKIDWSRFPATGASPSLMQLRCTAHCVDLDLGEACPLPLSFLLHRSRDRRDLAPTSKVVPADRDPVTAMCVEPPDRPTGARRGSHHEAR